MRTLDRNGSARRLAGAVVLVLAVAACGAGGGGDDDPEGIASLGGDATTTTAGGGDGGGGTATDNQDFEEAMLEYAQCMRDNGVEDFPDPQFGEDGGTVMIGGQPGDDPPSEAEREAMAAADEECQPIMEDAVSDLPPPSPEEQAEARDQALAMSRCMRENGVEDFPDPQFDEDGRISIGIDRSLDPESSTFQEAQEICSEELGGPGGPRIGAAPGMGSSSGGDDE